MKQIAFFSLAILVVAGAIGCKEDSNADPLADYRDFKVERPEAFSGDFNSTNLEVKPKVGFLAPEIEGVDLDGTQFKLSDYRGKVVMLDFYGDW